MFVNLYIYKMYISGNKSTLTDVQYQVMIQKNIND